VAKTLGGVGGQEIDHLACPAVSKCSATGTFETREEQLPFVISQVR
jgi:hypothetical protein